MTRARRLVLALVAAIAVLVPVGFIAAASASPVAPAAGGPQHAMLPATSMHSRYLTALAGLKGKKLPVPEQAGATFQDNCTSTGCGPVTFHGGVVQHHPQLFVLLWGSSWVGETTYSPVLAGFATGLGNEANFVSSGAHDTWLSQVMQYGDTTTNVGGTWFYANGILGKCNKSPCTGTFPATYIDSTDPPNGLTQAQIQAEATAFFTTVGITPNSDDTVAVVSQHGTCPQDFAGDAGICPNGMHNYCAWHVWSTQTGNPSLINLPYMPDGSVCTPTGNNNGKFTAALGHEESESITDPLFTGWKNDTGGEIADECPGYQTITLATSASTTGTFTVQSLYNNTHTQCDYIAGAVEDIATPYGGGAGLIQGSGTTLCLNNKGNNTSNGNPITITSCNASGMTNGRETFSHNWDRRLRVQGKCVDDTGNGGTGTLQQLSTCTTQSRQQWIWKQNGSGNRYGQYSLISQTGQCLTRGTTDGSQVKITACATGTIPATQLWPLPGATNP
jgi:Ricin-type beta-trefoil lectin domain